MNMSDKTFISNVELELTQRMQLHFPRGVIPVEVLQAWNSCPAEALQEHLLRNFSQAPQLNANLGPVAVAQARQHIIKGRFGRKEYPVTVDYGLSLKDMVGAGRYDWTNSDITAECFPIKGKGKVGVKLEPVHLNRRVSYQQARKELNRQGFRSAKTEEFLAFGAAYPKKQYKFPIICLGSGRSRSVLFLFHEDNSRRVLDLFRCGYDYSISCRFLAVRK